MNSEFRNSMTSKGCLGGSNVNPSRDIAESSWSFFNDRRFNTVYIAIIYAFNYSILDEKTETIQLDDDLTAANLNPGVTEVDTSELKQLLDSILSTANLSEFDYKILFKVTSSSDLNGTLTQIFTENTDFVTFDELESYFYSLLALLQEHISSSGMEQTLKNLIGISYQGDDLDDSTEI